MTHLDTGTLADLALGESTPEQTRLVGAHVRQCGRCLRELESLRRVVRAGRPTSAGPLTLPPERIWQNITDHLDDDSGRTSCAAPTAVPRRRPRYRMWLLAACVLLVAGGAVWGAKISWP